MKETSDSLTIDLSDKDSQVESSSVSSPKNRKDVQPNNQIYFNNYIFSAVIQDSIEALNEKISSIKWDVFEQKKEFLKLINE